MRRILAVRARSRAAGTWPILPGSETPPEGWPGWSESRKFAFVLTHDVEGRRGLARVRQLAELEMELGFRSSFNFVPEGAYDVPAELRDWLTERGFEVGVHDLHHDGKLYASRGAFLQNADRINRHLQSWNACGFRSAFMLHNLEWLHDLNVRYDASTFDTDPFEPQPDGAGTIFPFWISSSDSGASRDGYMELPYTLPQDSTLFLVLGETTTRIWREKLDWVADHGGMALVNVHPDYVAFDTGGDARTEFSVDLYREFLQYVRDRHLANAWHVLPREIAAYCQPILRGKAVTNM